MLLPRHRETRVCNVQSDNVMDLKEHFVREGRNISGIAFWSICLFFMHLEMYTIKGTRQRPLTLMLSCARPEVRPRIRYSP